MLAFLRIVSFVLAIIIAGALFYNALSNYVLGGNTSIFSADPFNFQNRLRYLYAQVVRSDINVETLNQLQDIADADTKFEPLNAKIFAIGGAIKQRTDKESAQAYYDKALSLERAERIALTQKYIYLIENGNYKDAIPIAELLLARWPFEFEKLKPTLPLLIQTPETLDAVLERFHSRSKGMNFFVQSILQYTDRIGLAYTFVLEAHNQYDTVVHQTSKPIMLELIKQNKVLDAYLLFHKTLSKGEKKSGGYIHNSNFQGKLTSAYFDWDIRSKSGVNMKVIPTRVLDSAEGQQRKAGGLEIKFLNAPVVFSNVNQPLYLPKKKYELLVKYSVDGFKGPSPVSVQIQCLKTRVQLAELELSQSETTEKIDSVIFEIPTSGCDIQRVLITNNNTVESWQNRFNGKVTFHDIKVEVSGVRSEGN